MTEMVDVDKIKICVTPCPWPGEAAQTIINIRATGIDMQVMGRWMDRGIYPFPINISFSALMQSYGALDTCGAQQISH
jgi:hypothetical protein